MTTFDELDAYLGVDYNIDFWSDFAIDDATKMADSLDDAEWDRLEKTWRDRSVGWQVRLAESIFGSNKQRVMSLLCQMLGSSDYHVALAAAESLNAKEDMCAPDPALLVNLQSLLKHVVPGERIIIQELIDRMESK